MRALTGTGEAQHFTPGIVLVTPSLAIMPWTRTGLRLAVAGSTQTSLCTYLSAVLLAGLLRSTLFGWPWDDPIAALVIAAVAVKEGQEAWRGDNCCAVPLNRIAEAKQDSCGAVQAAHAASPGRPRSGDDRLSLGHTRPRGLWPGSTFGVRAGPAPQHRRHDFPSPRSCHTATVCRSCPRRSRSPPAGTALHSRTTLTMNRPSACAVPLQVCDTFPCAGRVGGQLLRPDRSHSSPKPDGRGPATYAPR